MALLLPAVAAGPAVGQRLWAHPRSALLLLQHAASPPLQLQVQGDLLLLVLADPHPLAAAQLPAQLLQECAQHHTRCYRVRAALLRQLLPVLV
jgi:hypothetical protein